MAGGCQIKGVAGMPAAVAYHGSGLTISATRTGRRPPPAAASGTTRTTGPMVRRACHGRAFRCGL